MKKVTLTPSQLVSRASKIYDYMAAVSAKWLTTLQESPAHLTLDMHVEMVLDEMKRDFSKAIAEGDVTSVIAHLICAAEFFRTCAMLGDHFEGFEGLASFYAPK